MSTAVPSLADSVPPASFPGHWALVLWGWGPGHQRHLAGGRGAVRPHRTPTPSCKAGHFPAPSLPRAQGAQMALVGGAPCSSLYPEATCWPHPTVTSKGTSGCRLHSQHWALSPQPASRPREGQSRPHVCSSTLPRPSGPSSWTPTAPHHHWLLPLPPPPPRTQLTPPRAQQGRGKGAGEKQRHRERPAQDRAAPACVLHTPRPCLL